MLFNCAICHNDKEGRKYVYASSNRAVKMYVCKDCHKAKVGEMQDTASKFGKGMTLGVLQVNKEE